MDSPPNSDAASANPDTTSNRDSAQLSESELDEFHDYAKTGTFTRENLHLMAHNKENATETDGQVRAGETSGWYTWKLPRDDNTLTVQFSTPNGVLKMQHHPDGSKVIGYRHSPTNKTGSWHVKPDGTVVTGEAKASDVPRNLWPTY